MENIKDTKEIKVYIKCLSGDILTINLNPNDPNNLNTLNKKVFKTLENIKDDYTIHHPYKVYYRSVLYPDRPPENDILYFPPSISHFRHPYRLFPLEVKEEGSVKDGDIYGIVSYGDLRANIDFSSSFNSNDKYTYKNINFYVFIYKIKFKLETILNNSPYKDPELLYIYQTIEIRLLKRKTSSSLVIPYSEINDINENINENINEKIDIKEKSLFEAFFGCKELSDFNQETRLSIVNELINFIKGKVYSFNDLIDLNGF